MSVLGIYMKIMKSLSQKGICSPTFSAALFTIVKKGKQPKCPSMDDEENVNIYIIHIYSYIYMNIIQA